MMLLHIGNFRDLSQKCTLETIDLERADIKETIEHASDALSYILNSLYKNQSGEPGIYRPKIETSWKGFLTY